MCFSKRCPANASVFCISSYGNRSWGNSTMFLGIWGRSTRKARQPQNQRTMQSFFNWYYATVGISVTISVVFMVYLQNAAGWVVGYGVPVGLMLLSAAMFFLGSSLYVKLMANKSLLSSLAQVTVAAWRNRTLEFPPQDSDKWFYHKGSKLVTPTPKLRYFKNQIKTFHNCCLRRF